MKRSMGMAILLVLVTVSVVGGGVKDDDEPVVNLSGEVEPVVDLFNRMADAAGSHTDLEDMVALLTGDACEIAEYLNAIEGIDELISDVYGQDPVDLSYKNFIKFVDAEMEILYALGANDNAREIIRWRLWWRWSWGLSTAGTPSSSEPMSEIYQVICMREVSPIDEHKDREWFKVLVRKATGALDLAGGSVLAMANNTVLGTQILGDVVAGLEGFYLADAVRYSTREGIELGSSGIAALLR